MVIYPDMVEGKDGSIGSSPPKSTLDPSFLSLCNTLSKSVQPLWIVESQ